MTTFVKIFLLCLIPAFSILLLAQRHENVAKVTGSRPCADFHKKTCMHLPDEGFAYNAQSRSGLFTKGQQFSVKAIFFKRMDYHISVCTEDKSLTNFIIKDARTEEILYNNAKDNYTEEVQISNENTRTIKIEITLAGTKESSEKKNTIKGREGVCAGILIEHRRSDKSGF